MAKKLNFLKKIKVANMSKPHWEVMADDGMNKFLKFVLFCLFAYGFYEVVLALIDRFI